MVDLEFFPEELKFLQFYNGDRHLEYRQSNWLSSPFDAEVWSFSFMSTDQYNIDFRVKLENGSLLTDIQNRSLLELFKSWICIQTHIDNTGGKFYAAQTAYTVTQQVLTLIDYFLINSKHFKLSQFGLRNVTENDITVMLAQLASSNEVAMGIYQWPTRLNDYLQGELLKADISSLITEIQENPILAFHIPDEDEWMLNLTEQEIIYSRAILWQSGFYKTDYRKTKNIESYRYSPSTEKLSQIIYANTLRGGLKKPIPSELLLAPFESYSKEFRSAPVRNETNEYLSEIKFESYKRTIRSLGQLSEVGASVPLNALNVNNYTINQSAFKLNSKGRYRTLPQEVVFTSLCKAVEFALSYGPELLESVATLIDAAHSSGKSCMTFVYSNDIRSLIHPKIRDLGVKFWHLGYHMTHVERSSIHSNDARASSEEYFKRFRNHEGLHELLRVFYGAVQICTGILMARRQFELRELVAGKALDKGNTFLIFYNGKSGGGGMRNKEARPIPPVIVELIELLENFHKRLVDIGVSTPKTQLFSYPNYQSGRPVKLLSPKYNASFEIFCDYIETPKNDIGERYYIRQHQLRRFFSMIFFWGNSFGGMETLRWFLGHTDIEHLYHYITESTPGYILLSSKAHYGSELLKTNSNDATQLADIVEKHFRTRNFQILDSDELEEYIEELLIEGRLEIEPIFFEGPDGKAFRVAIKTVEKIGNEI